MRHHEDLGASAWEAEPRRALGERYSCCSHCPAVRQGTQSQKLSRRQNPVELGGVVRLWRT